MADTVLPPGTHITYRRQYTRCNRQGCRTCLNQGPGHGPYWYAYWHEAGRLRSRYLGKQTPPGARTATAEPLGHPDLERGAGAPPPGQGPASALRVRSLGGFAIWRDGRRIPDRAWSRRKAASLFKALLSAPDYRLHREQVAELLWPDSDPISADSSLRFTLHQLRSILDPPDARNSYILSRDHALILIADPGRDEEAARIGAEDWLDAARFAAAAGRALAGEDQRACEAALAHYGGPYLPEDRYEDWVLPRGEELGRLHITLLLHHARIVGNKGQANERVPAWQAVLDADPCQEEAAYALMRALEEDGLTAEALRVYGTFAAALRAELQVSPAAAIERVRARLLAPRVPTTVDTVHPPVAGPAALMTNLPMAMTSFVGRRHEQSALLELLDDTRLLTLTGIGGSGKTRLALRVAEALLERFPDGVWLVELATLSDPAGVLDLVARAVGMSDLPPGHSLPDGLTRHLQSRRLLLVLDNCEHVLGACAALVESLLAGCPHLRILATSREGLDLPGETTFRVPPLSMPPRDAPPLPNDLLECEAVQLFVERARSHRPDFALTERNAGAVGSICTQLDGLPLALELAAARIRSLSVENIEARLDQCFQLLTGGPRTTLPRQHTLRATLDWSYDLLSAPERVLLRRLSVFAGGWTLEAAEAICAGEPIGDWEVLDVLSMLVDKSLVELSGSEAGARYWLQETMRQYAQEKLTAGDEAARARGRHLAWYLRLAEEGSAGLLGPEQLSWLNRLTAEHDNLRAALSWSTTGGMPRGADLPVALRLAGFLWPFWRMRGFPHEGRRWLDTTLATPGSVSPESRARALDGAGVLAADQGDYTRARALHEESLALWRSVGDRRGVAGALNNLGSVAQQQGEHQAAHALHEESLALWRALDDAAGAAGALNQLACIARDAQGDYGRAGQLLEESLALRRSLGDTRGIAISLNNLGLVVYYQGDYGRAGQLLEEGLALRRSLGDRRGIANSLGNLGLAAIGQGNDRDGASLYQQSLALRREQGDRRGIVECLEGLAMVAFLRHEPEWAARLLGVAEALREEIGFPHSRPIGKPPGEMIAALSRALGEDGFVRAWTAGRSLTPEQALSPEWKPGVHSIA